MEMLAVALVALVVLGPIVAIIMAARALGRARELEQELRRQAKRMDAMSRRLREDGAPTPALEPEARPAAVETPEPEPATPAEEAEAAAPPPLPEPLPAPKAIAARAPAAAPEATPPGKPFDLEALLGGSLLIWIGGVALALAGAFLVKYSFDQGWIGPGTRIVLACAFGLTLIGAGEWLRSRSARVAQASCAAGVAVLFAALLAATNLYALIPPLAGFTLLALTTAAAVVLSLRHGPFVAGLGLLGGFLTPALIRAETPSAPLLFGYLFALQLGLLVVCRSRGWWPLGLFTVLGVHAWAFVWLFDMPTGPHEPWLALFVLSSTAATVLLTLGDGASDAWGDNAGRAVAPVLGWIAGVLGLITASAVVHAGAFSNMEWGFLLLLSAGGLVLALLDERYEAIPWLTASAGVVLLFDWAATGVPVPERFALIAAAGGALHAVGAFALAARASRPDRWAALSVAASIAYLLAAFAELPDPFGPLPWGLIALLLAGAHAAAVAWLLPRREEAPGAEGRMAAHAIGATALTSLAIAFELEREWMAVAWALQLPVLALLHARFRLQGLRRLAAGIGLLVAARLLLNPGVLDYPIGDTPVFNLLLWGYLVPAASCWFAARVFRQDEDDELVFGLELGTIAFGAAWAALTIRHLFHPENIDSTSWTLAEMGLIASLFLAAGGALAWFGAERERQGLRIGGHALALVGLGGLVLGPCLRFNPLVDDIVVAGPRLLNTLVLAYGLPAALTAAWAVLLRHREATQRAAIAATASLGLTFLFVTLEVRHWFQGAVLDSGAPGNAELYAYSTCWIALGVLLLLAGLRLSSRALRQAALAVMLISVAKVFLFDMRELEDLLRVLSFFGLGVSLLALGYLYQRFVLRQA